MNIFVLLNIVGPTFNLHIVVILSCDTIPLSAPTIYQDPPATGEKLDYPKASSCCCHFGDQVISPVYLTSSTFNHIFLLKMFDDAIL